MSDDLIIFIITAVLWLGFYMGVIKNNKGFIMKLDGKLEKVVTTVDEMKIQQVKDQAINSTKVDQTLSVVNEIRSLDNMRAARIEKIEQISFEQSLNIRSLQEKIQVMEKRVS